MAFGRTGRGLTWQERLDGHSVFSSSWNSAEYKQIYAAPISSRIQFIISYRIDEVSPAFRLVTKGNLVLVDVINNGPGGRTAWSSTVTVTRSNPPTQHNLRARFWYDGAYIDNAKEDAAEVAVLLLTGAIAPNPSGGGST